MMDEFSAGASKASQAASEENATFFFKSCAKEKKQHPIFSRDYDCSHVVLLVDFEVFNPRRGQ